MNNFFAVLLILIFSYIANADEYSISDRPGYYSIKLLIDKCPTELNEAVFNITQKINSNSKKKYVAVLPEVISGEYFQVDYMTIDRSTVSPIGRIKFEFKYWGEGTDRCDRVEPEDYIY